MPQEIEACRVCGKAWTKWSSSKLQCHAKCYPPELMEDVLRLKEQFPHATLRRIATDLGFSVGTIRCWLFMAWKRRQDQPSTTTERSLTVETQSAIVASDDRVTRTH